MKARMKHMGTKVFWKLCFASVAGALGLWASPAGAEVVTFTFSGHVDAGVDKNGLFGAAGADLAGIPFSLVASFDDTIGAIPGLIGISSYGSLSSGDPPGTPGPTGTVATSFTVGGAAYDLGSVPNALYLATLELERPLPTERGTFTLVLQDPFKVNLFLQLRSYDLNFANGGLELKNPMPVPGSTSTGGVEFFSGPNFERLSFDVEKAFIDKAPPLDATDVPEPASWTFTIAGLALAGAMLRRCRRLAWDSQPAAGK